MRELSAMPKNTTMPGDKMGVGAPPGLPPNTWPTFRWVARWLRHYGCTQRSFVEAAGMSRSTWHNAADKPDRPLPFTDQWRDIVAHRTRYKNAGLLLMDRPTRKTTRQVHPEKCLMRWSDVEVLAEQAGEPAFGRRLAGAAHVSTAAIASWRRQGYVPDTASGRGYVNMLRDIARLMASHSGNLR